MTKDSLEDEIRKAVRRDIADGNRIAGDIQTTLVKFHVDDKRVDLNFDFNGDTVWASYKQMAGLFGCTEQDVTQHIAELFTLGEVSPEATTQDFLLVQREGKRSVQRRVRHFNLDVILLVGFRVNSARAIQFRKWASQILKAYITQGYALNEVRLENDPAALQRLAEEVRTLRERSKEKEEYLLVREVAKVSAVDYDDNYAVTRTFFAQLQNTFHYAVNAKTAGQILLDRSRYQLPNMGMTCGKPTLKNAGIAKNYLTAQELRRYRILAEHFVLFVEERIARGETITMKQLIEQFERLLDAGGYPKLPKGPDYRAGKAQRHVQAEYAMWSMRQKRVTDQRPSR